jgi:uncharacterized membrane protein YdbT with pleckstrin-like domain
MAYPESVLADNEKLLLHRHPHWKTLVGALLVGIIVTVLASAAGVALGAATLTGPWATILLIVVVIAWVVAMVWWVLAPIVRWATNHFVITDQRVMFRTGVFKRTGIDIPILRINTVRFEHGFIDRILGTGTLIVESASDDPLQFRDIPQVEKVHSMLYSQLNSALDKEPEAKG